jgi:hypothetical protein
MLFVVCLTIISEGSDNEGGQFELMPSNSLGATLLDRSPTVSTVYRKTNTASTVSVLDDFLNSSHNTRLSRSERLTDFDCVCHFITLLPFLVSQLFVDISIIAYIQTKVKSKHQKLQGFFHLS